MRVPTMSSKQGLKVVLMAVAFLAVPAWADDAGSFPMAEERQRLGTLMVEVQPPALDGSVYGLRVEISPSAEGDWTFGMMRRIGSWNRMPGARARFTGTNVGDVKLAYAIGAEGRYTLASFGNGALRPFVSLTAGVEEFEVRSRENASGLSYATGVFAEPALGVMYRPGAGRVGLTARVGPGFTSTNGREHTFGDGTLRLRSVYPAASAGLVFVLF